jgi:quercetin dioxygenase-like cupin family protein
MSRYRRFAVIVAGLVAAVAGVAASQTSTFTRTQLQDQPLSIPGRHGVMARSEFPAGVESGRHFHPGEELGYLLEGTLQLTLDGQAPKMLKAGDVIFIPAGTVHNAKNTGTTVAKVLATYVLETGKPLATPVK